MIPDGKDPDEFIRENGKELFIKLLEKKKNYPRFFMELLFE